MRVVRGMVVKPMQQRAGRHVGGQDDQCRRSADRRGHKMLQNAAESPAPGNGGETVPYPIILLESAGGVKH